MAKKDLLTKILAIAGTVLVLFPVLATVLTGTMGTIQSGMLRFDYLLPAELFWLVLAGGGLLLWAALRARSRRGFIAWSLGAAVFPLLFGMLMAVVTGINNTDTDPTGVWLVVVYGSIVVYDLAVVALSVGGILLLIDLFK
jgi:hypothetical protein